MLTDSYPITGLSSTINISSEDKDVNKEQLNKIKRLSRSIFSYLPEQIHENSCISTLKIGGVFLSEICLPFINGFVGMHSLLLDHLHSYLDNIFIIYMASAALSSIDSVVHYALAFSVYKTGAGLSPALTEDEIKEKRKQVSYLSKTITLLLESKNETFFAPAYLSKLDEYYQCVKEEKQADEVTFPGEIGKGILLGVFIALRVSSGYFIMTKFFLAIGAVSFALTPLGLGIMWCVIALYTYNGYLTRRAAIFSLLYPLPEQEFIELEKNYNELKEKLGVDPAASGQLTSNAALPVSQQELTDNIKGFYSTVCSALPQKSSHKSFLTLGGIALSEIGVPLVNGFVGMHSLIADHLHSLDNVFIYLASAVLASIDAVVHYALMFPVYKEGAVDISPELTTKDDIKTTRERLISLNKLITRLIETEEEKSEKLLREADLEELENCYQEIISKEGTGQEITCLRELGKGILLGVFIALRVSGGYFIITKFFLAIGAAPFALTPLGLGIMWCVIALYAYNGYLTRRTAISDLLYPLPKKEFTEMREKFRKLKLMHDLAEINNVDEKDHQLTSLEEITEQLPSSTDLGKIDFQRLETLISKKTNLKEKNEIFQAGKDLKIFNKCDHCLDKILFFERPRTWKEGIKKIRENVYDSIVNGPGSNDEKIKKLNTARDMPIFKMPRDWFFGLGAIRKTATVKKIDETILQLRRRVV